MTAKEGNVRLATNHAPHFEFQKTPLARRDAGRIEKPRRRLF